METNPTVQRIAAEEVFTLANGIVEHFQRCDDTFWDEVENLFPEDDGDALEVYQWFIVSGWLFDKLGQIGAVRVEFAGAYFWGRTEYGNSLEYDGDLNKVAALIS